MDHMPLVAVFILFDFVVHNPDHQETKTNLAFLDVAVGYFRRLEMVTRGASCRSTIAEFADIARNHVLNPQRAKNGPTIRWSIQQGARTVQRDWLHIDRNLHGSDNGQNEPARAAAPTQCTSIDAAHALEYPLSGSQMEVTSLQVWRPVEPITIGVEVFLLSSKLM